MNYSGVYISPFCSAQMDQSTLERVVGTKPENNSWTKRLDEAYRKSDENRKRSWDEAKDALRPFRGFFRVVLVILVVIGLVVVIGSFVDKEELYCSNTEDAAFSAYAHAEVYIVRQLREPKSAIRPSGPIRVDWLGECKFLVVGSIKAKNGFGGYVQNIYMIKTRYDVASDRHIYELISFQ